MSRPSDGFTIEELRDEFDWTFEFNSRMAERIREDADVHSLVDYVNKLEAENAKLQEELEAAKHDLSMFSERIVGLDAVNAKLRELIADVHESLKADKAGMFHNLTLSAMEDDMRELGIEVDYGQQRDV